MTNQAKVQRVSGLRPGIALTLTVKTVLLLSVLIAGAAVNSVEAQTCMLQGTVSVSSPNGQNERLPGASLKLTPAGPNQASRSAVTDDQGEFKFTDLTPGLYTLQIDLAGFQQRTESVTVHPDVTSLESIALEVQEISGEVTVVAGGDGLNTTDATTATTFNQNRLETVPLANERFQDAIPLVPGIVRGPDGMINVKGARSSQSGMIVNSSSVTDPVTGESAINLPIEAVQSVEVLTNPYAPEYGQFTGAVTTVQTRSGSEKFHANATSFFPRVRRRGGSFVGIEAFTPRVTFSGPVINDKLKFFQSFEYRFVRTPVENLPALQRDTDLESFDSVSQLDWDINELNHLTTTLSLYPEKLRYVGLNTFNPQEVTPNFKHRGFLVAINEVR